MTSSSALENLSRLASKPGVQSTLVLSRVDGTIIRTTGLLSDEGPNSESVNVSSGPEGNHVGLNDKSSGNSGYVNEERGSQNTAEGVAKMVFSFVSTASGLVSGLEKDDDIQLLRLRTKKSEIVIVPDSKYLLVVLHDPPNSS
ncbi:hypothetical protein MMC13_004720 [Lambiella insularis]|nr:hypothetical protein [Lambiella insularis]